MAEAALDGTISHDGWQKASFSVSKQECIEVKEGEEDEAGLVLVRDSKDPTGPHLGFTREQFANFAGAIVSGEFDEFKAIPVEEPGGTELN